MDLLFFIITIFFACFLQGIIGFGYAIVAVPLALNYLDKETVVFSTLIIGFVLNGYLARKIRSEVDYRLVALLFVASIIGMPIGIWILKTIQINTMKVLVGILAVLFTAIIYIIKPRFSKNNFLVTLVGFVSGLLHTSTGMSGPPVIFLLTTKKDTPTIIYRDTLATLFFFMSFVSIILFIGSQIITFERAIFAAYSLPFVFLGGYLGDRTASNVSKKLFRIMTFGIVILSGLYSIYSGLR